MSPKVSRPGGEPDNSELPAGHVPMARVSGPESEPRKPIPLWLKVGGFVALLVVTVGTIVYLGRPEDPRSSAEGTAELVAKALSDGDSATFRSCTCDIRVFESAAVGLNLRAKSVTTVTDVVEEGDDRARADLWSKRFPSDRSITLSLHDRNGSWCVSAVG